MSNELNYSSQESLNQLIYRHHLWANLRLLDACLNLDETQLNHADSGTYGTIRETLAHLLRAEERYLYFITTGAFAVTADLNPQTPLTRMKQCAQRSGEALLDVLARVQPDLQVPTGDEEDPELTPVGILLLQAIHHAHEHRTQVETMMGQQGIEPPGLSGWRYFDKGV